MIDDCQPNQRKIYLGLTGYTARSVITTCTRPAIESVLLLVANNTIDQTTHDDEHEENTGNDTDVEKDLIPIGIWVRSIDWLRYTTRHELFTIRFVGTWTHWLTDRTTSCI